MSLLPARRLEKFCPAMRKKGRLCLGADADVTVFDAATVADRATWTEPALKSAGNARIEHVGKSQSCMVSKSPIICPRQASRMCLCTGSRSCWMACSSRACRRPGAQSVVLNRGSSFRRIRVRFQMILNARTDNVGKYQSCMFLNHVLCGNRP